MSSDGSQWEAKIEDEPETNGPDINGWRFFRHDGPILKVKRNRKKIEVTVSAIVSRRAINSSGEETRKYGLTPPPTMRDALWKFLDGKVASNDSYFEQAPTPDQLEDFVTFLSKYIERWPVDRISVEKIGVGQEEKAFEEYPTSFVETVGDTTYTLRLATPPGVFS